MDLQIRSKGLILGTSFHDHVERRMEFCLGRFAQVSRARVLLADVNGPRGGVDKLCRIEISLRSLSHVFAQGVGADLLSAVDDAAGHAAHSVERELGRSRRLRRPRPRHRAIEIDQEEPEIGIEEWPPAEWPDVDDESIRRCSDSNSVTHGESVQSMLSGEGGLS